jgi:dipeptidyl-peptidase 4
MTSWTGTFVLRGASLLALLMAIWLCCSIAQAATNDPTLTLDRLFDSSEFDEAGPGTIRWSQRRTNYFTFEKTASGGPGRDLMAVDPATGDKELIAPAHLFIPPQESSPLSVEAFEFSADESKLLIFTASKRVWRQRTRGDYWVLDISSRELRKLGGDAPPSSLMFAKFSPDGSRVAYVRANNLYVQRLRDLHVHALTTDGTLTLINGTSDWVYEEELDLRDGFAWSPDGQSIAYWQLDSSGVRPFYLINNTESFYPQIQPIPYPKTGEQNSAARIGVVRAEGGHTRWLELSGNPREHYLARMIWASNSTEVLVQQFNRLQNTNRVLLGDAQTGRTRTILTETDRAWVENENEVRWVLGGEQFIWLSERDGWRHAYRVSRDGAQVTLLTPGEFDVISLEALDTRNGWLYYLASPDHPTQRYLFRVPVEGGAGQRLTPADQPGTHRYDISPDTQWAIHTYSRFDRPPVTELVRLPDHKSVRVLEENKKLRDKLDTLRKPSSEFFRVEVATNVWLDGWCVKPPEFDPNRKYPVLFHVYGEPAGQTVVDSWHGKTLLWHWMLAQQGYLIMSVDNRGTKAPRGRDWRKSIYRQVGILASSDQASALQEILKRWSYVDPKRVGVWGWSGGGSMTLNAVLRYPDLYSMGMAVAAVPNQRYYDTIYQERYMGLPEDNAEGYRRGSPITYARQLKGDLLIVHGTGDDNVHYQGAEALINELITYNKPFSMMAYPNRSHGIGEGHNTRRHLFSLLTKYLNQHLPVNTPAPIAPPPTLTPKPPGADYDDDE